MVLGACVGVRATRDNAGGDNTEAGDILYSLDNVTYVHGSTSKGEGKLALTTSAVYWYPKKEGESPESFAYQDIVMHAVSPGSGSYPPCIYCHLDSEDVTEIRFCPPDEGHLDEMFFHFNKGAELNPDAPGEEERDGEEEAPFYFNAEEFGVENDPSVRIHGSGLGMMSPEQFMEMITRQGIEVYDNVEDAFEDQEEDSDH